MVAARLGDAVCDARLADRLREPLEGQTWNLVGRLLASKVARSIADAVGRSGFPGLAAAAAEALQEVPWA